MSDLTTKELTILTSKITNTSSALRRKEFSDDDRAAILAVLIDEAADTAALINHTIKRNADLRHLRADLRRCKRQSRQLHQHLLSEPEDGLRVVSFRIPDELHHAIKTRAGSHYGAFQEFITDILFKSVK